MAQKLYRAGRERKSAGSVADLPPSADKAFWLGHVETIEPEPAKECKHYFVRTAANTVECKYCHIGFYVGHDVIIRKGHLYKGNKKIL